MILSVVCTSEENRINYNCQISIGKIKVIVFVKKGIPQIENSVKLKGFGTVTNIICGAIYLDLWHNVWNKTSKFKLCLEQ